MASLVSNVMECPSDRGAPASISTCSFAVGLTLEVGSDEMGGDRDWVFRYLDVLIFIVLLQ